MIKINCVIFVMGVSVGAAVSWLLTKKHYEQIAQEEIDSVKEVYAKRKLKNDEKQNEEDLNNVECEMDIVKNKSKLKNNLQKHKDENRTNYNEYSNKKYKEKYDPMTNVPYVISPDEYGENDNYTLISLSYYEGDGVLADDGDEVVDNIEETVGVDFATHFGEYEDDSIFIRNERLKCDYEILKDHRSFSDITESSDY